LLCASINELGNLTLNDTIPELEAKLKKMPDRFDQIKAKKEQPKRQLTQLNTYSLNGKTMIDEVCNGREI